MSVLVVFYYLYELTGPLGHEKGMTLAAINWKTQRQTRSELRLKQRTQYRTIILRLVSN